jgi:thioesterase domain-containing protein
MGAGSRCGGDQRGCAGQQIQPDQARRPCRRVPRLSQPSYSPAGPDPLAARGLTAVLAPLRRTRSRDTGQRLDRLREDQPFYALQSRDRPGEEPTLEELAADYARAVLRDVPGPRYRLGGWSMGGVLAMELARELQSQGCLIDFVIAIDVLEGPGQLRRPLGGRRGLLSWLGRDLAGLTGLPWFPGDGNGSDGAFDPPSELFESLRSQGVLPADIDRVEFDATFARFESNARALYGYRPKPFDGSMYFLRAESGATFQAAEGWRSVCRGSFEEIVVPGNHYTVLKSANVDAVASSIRSILARQS